MRCKAIALHTPTTTREFQDPSSLSKAWALPVAQRYRAGLHYQSNGSFCGPASVANVMRSLGHEGDLMEEPTSP